MTRAVPPLLGLEPGMALRESDGSETTYVVERYIDRGGFGEVWCCQQVTLNRSRGLVALKFLNQNVPPEHVERFQNEARFSASLPNTAPSVVRCVDDGTLMVDATPVHFAAFEYLPTRSRFDLRALAKRASVFRAISVFIDACAALHSIHSQGVIHRDLNPKNVLLTPGDVVRIIDFGLATLTMNGESVGIPEHIDGVTRRAGRSNLDFEYPGFGPRETFISRVPDDERFDVFQLGVHLFLFLSGMVPYMQREHHFEEPHNRRSHLRGLLDHEAFETAVGSIPASVFDCLAELATDCVRSERRHRPASALAISERAQEALEQLGAAPDDGPALADLRIRALIGQELAFMLERKETNQPPSADQALRLPFERQEDGKYLAGEVPLTVLEDFVRAGGELLLCWQGADPYALSNADDVALYGDDLCPLRKVELTPQAGVQVQRLAPPAERLADGLKRLGTPTKAIGETQFSTWRDVVAVQGDTVLDKLATDQLASVADALAADAFGTPENIRVAIARRCLDVRRLAELLRVGLHIERLEQLVANLGAPTTEGEDLAAALARHEDLFGRRGLTARDLRQVASRWGVADDGPRGRLLVRIAFSVPPRPPAPQ